MSSQRSTELKVGIVSFLAVILLIIGISIGKGLHFGGRQDLALLRFPSSGGIESGAPVFVNGVKRGSVISVENNNNAVLVTASLGDMSDLRADASAKISMLEITGGRKIEILPGISEQPFDAKKEIRGSIVADATELIGMIGELGGDARILVKRLDTIIASVTSLLADSVSIGHIRHAIGQADTLATSVNSIIAQNKDNLRSAISTMNSLASELRQAVNVNEPKARKLLEELDSAASAANGLIAKIDLTANDARMLISDVRTITQDIRAGKGALSRIMYDPVLGSQLDSTVNKITRLFDFIEANGVNVNVRLGTRP